MSKHSARADLAGSLRRALNPSPGVLVFGHGRVEVWCPPAPTAREIRDGANASEILRTVQVRVHSPLPGGPVFGAKVMVTDEMERAHANQHRGQEERDAWWDLLEAEVDRVKRYVDLTRKRHPEAFT